MFLNHLSLDIYIIIYFKKVFVEKLKVSNILLPSSKHNVKKPNFMVKSQKIIYFIYHITIILNIHVLKKTFCLSSLSIILIFELPNIPFNQKRDKVLVFSHQISRQ